MFDKNRFRAQIILAGMTAKELADKIGIDESTLYRKINADGNFTRKEIGKIVEILHIDDPKDIFFADNLA